MSRPLTALLAAVLSATLATAGAGPVAPALATTETTTTGTTEASTEVTHRSAELGAVEAPLSDLTTGSADAVPTTSGGAEISGGELPHTADPTLRAEVDTPEGVTVVGLVWEGEAAVVDPVTGVTSGATASVRVRQGGEWGPWQSLGESIPADGTDDGDGRWATDATVVVDAEDVQVELSGQVATARVETWTNAVTSDDIARVAALPPVSSTSKTLPIGTREDWGVDRSIRDTPIISSTPKLGVTLHHTVTAPVYDPEEVPATLRSIHNYHARTLGWGDIGYNMFVDQHGRVWEGRDGGLEKNVQGAHAVGMNTDWFGLSVIGDHETQPVKSSQHTSIAASAAWVLNTHGADVRQTRSYYNRTRGWTRTLPIFHGHEDVDYTLCPGINLIAIMDQLRVKIATEQLAGRTAVHRVGGQDRYVVAAAMAREAFPRGTGTAYLAAGGSMADALGVGPAADRNGAAVLLTRTDALPSVTLRTLRELGVWRVRVVGGDEVVAPAVRTALVNDGFTVERIAGGSRYDTAALLAGASSTVYVANGMNPADALGGAAAAAEKNASILLTRTEGLPSITAATLRRLAPTRVVVLGGEGAISSTVRSQIAAAVPGARVDRIGGLNRFETSALVARDAFGSADAAVVANAHSPADAMVGTQVAAAHDGPVLLTRATCQPRSVSETVGALGIDLTRLAGGSGVLDWKAGSTTC